MEINWLLLRRGRKCTAKFVYIHHLFRGTLQSVNVWSLWNLAVWLHLALSIKIACALLRSARCNGSVFFGIGRNRLTQRLIRTFWLCFVNTILSWLFASQRSRLRQKVVRLWSQNCALSWLSSTRLGGIISCLCAHWIFYEKVCECRLTISLALSIKLCHQSVHHLVGGTLRWFALLWSSVNESLEILRRPAFRKSTCSCIHTTLLFDLCWPLSRSIWLSLSRCCCLHLASWLWPLKLAVWDGIKLKLLVGDCFARVGDCLRLRRFLAKGTSQGALVRIMCLSGGHPSNL